MATFNTTTVVKRYNRPNITIPTLLENFFVNNGTYFNPFALSAVYIIPDTGATNGSPEIYINRQVSDLGTDSYGLLNATGLSSVVATFDISNTGGVPGAEANYLPPIGVSSIYQVSSGTSAGHFAVVVDQNGFPNFSAVGNYFDIWCVQDFTGSKKKLYWNKFSIYDDRVITFTEPFQITTRNKLYQKYIPLSSIVSLRVDTEHFVANKDMAKDIKNIWRNSVIDNAAIQIRQRHPQTTGQMTNTVPWTSSGVNVSSEDTITYLWDTSELTKGDYTVQVKYTLLTETIYSEEFSLVLR